MMAQLPSTLRELIQLDKTSLSTSDRRRALQLTRTLTKQLETPVEVMVRHMWVEQTFIAALTVCNELGIFKVLGKHKPQYLSVPAIAAEITAQGQQRPAPAFLARLLRHLANEGAVLAQEPEVYAATPLSEALGAPGVGSAVRIIQNMVIPTFGALPAFSAITGYQEPNSGEQLAFQHTKKTSHTFYDYLVENPKDMEAFRDWMECVSVCDDAWTDIYPFYSRVLEEADEAGPLVVDIGGGNGQYMKALLNSYPAVAGRLIVQDLPSVIAATERESNKNIKLMAHDFFTPQPVIGARVYFLHWILHNWCDEDAIKILSKLRAAMKPGYSKLVINESIISAVDGNGSVYTGVDLCMMAFMAAKERTLQEWTALLEKAGFKITGTWTDILRAPESVIEAEPA